MRIYTYSEKVLCLLYFKRNYLSTYQTEHCRRHCLTQTLLWHPAKDKTGLLFSCSRKISDPYSLLLHFWKTDRLCGLLPKANGFNGANCVMQNKKKTMNCLQLHLPTEWHVWLLRTKVKITHCKNLKINLEQEHGLNLVSLIHYAQLHFIVVQLGSFWVAEVSRAEVYRGVHGRNRPGISQRAAMWSQGEFIWWSTSITNS